MKKFSRTAAAGLVAVAAVTLAGCHPPHQQPSDEKVANAATYTGEPKPGVGEKESASASAAPSEQAAGNKARQAGDKPQFQDCVAAPATEPATVTLNCADGANRVENIKWESWESDEAHGTGTRVTNANGHEERNDDVDVELHTPAETADGFAFTEIVVDGQPVEQ